ncbi:LPS -1,7-N-acetylglucosamine transferase Ecf2 [Escherichia coli]|nr:LPS -1,7-N-acetylglucosamine transferase Ecf2 [Escherichia coli]
MKFLYTESSPDIGGQELQAIAQMCAMQRSGHQVMLACREHSRISAETRHYGIPVVHIPFRNSLHLPSVLALRRLTVKFRPDIVVCHSGHDSNITGLVRASLPGRAGRFCIIRQKTYLTRKVRMFSLNHMCDVVVVPSGDVGSRLLSRRCLRPVVVVPPGTDFSSLRRQSGEALPANIDAWLKCREPAPVIVQVAMIRPEKGHHFMLSVLHRLKQEGLRFYWLIVGSGNREEEERLRAGIRQMGMEDCVLMCGLLSPVAPVYRIASLMVMPSRNESFGMVIVEAAACGTPVMASRVGGIPLVMQGGRNGVLLPPDDREAWINALKAFFSAPEDLQAMALQARRDVLSRYSIDRTVTELVKLGERYRRIRWGDDYSDEEKSRMDTSPGKVTDKNCAGVGRHNGERKLSALRLFVKLVTDPVYYRRRWEMRNFRYRFILRTLFVWPWVTFRYLQGLCRLEETERLLEANPVLPAKPHRPYLHRGGNARQRARAVLEHYHFVRTLPDTLRPFLQIYREKTLASLKGKNGASLDITCAPCGFDREGELMLILYCDGMVVTRISFSFIRWQDKYTLFIGGLQGPREEGKDIIRHATRQCHGLFPRRVLCEAVAVLAGICRLDTITAVSEEKHVLRHDRYAVRKQGRFVARYSDCWISVGGECTGDGFYRLPLPLPRKEEEDIPVRKRAEYRRRNALLNNINISIRAATGAEHIPLFPDSPEKYEG